MLAFTLCAVVLPACSGDPRQDPPPDPYADLRERLDLEPARVIHEVTIGGRGGEEHVVPSVLRVPLGAVVVFTTVDGRIHTVTFPEDSLPLDGALFLQRTGQMESPPLVDRGSRFVVTLEEAPPGRYRFRSQGPGGEAWGVLLVGDN